MLAFGSQCAFEGRLEDLLGNRSVVSTVDAAKLLIEAPSQTAAVRYSANQSSLLQ